MLALSVPLAACVVSADATSTSPATSNATTTDPTGDSTAGGADPTDTADPDTAGSGDSGGPGSASLTTDTTDAADTTDAPTSIDPASTTTTGTTDAGTSDTGTADTGTADTTGTTDTGTTGEPGVPVALGTAEDYVLLAKTAISTVPNSDITGDLGISPAAASFITGFSLIADPSNKFSTSTQVTGRVYAADYTPPTPNALTVAIGDMQVAFSDAASRQPDVFELGAGDIGGMQLGPGVYRWATSVLIPTDITLDGGADDVWIFQISQDLTLSSAAAVTLSGGAAPRNVFWQVSGAVELGTTAHLAGVVLTKTSVTLDTGASLDGRLLAQTAISLSSNTIVEPAP